MFLLRVDLAGCNPGHQIILGGGDELLLHQVQNLHRGHDVGDRAVHLQTGRLMARSLANHDRLDEITHDRHQPLLGMFVAVVACQEDELADADLGIGGIELRLQLRNLLLEILGRLLRLGEFQNQRLARDFQFIQLIIQDGKPWPAVGMAVLNLLHET
ncbi:hypothetical protein [Rhizobium sp. GCM10022189]|uniref:hypothetical protein n=1 Tax=Rhizobium sp. GCM10022189 TaxID=3252654 RepID=UPI00360E1F01